MRLNCEKTDWIRFYQFCIDGSIYWILWNDW